MKVFMKCFMKCFMESLKITVNGWNENKWKNVFFYFFCLISLIVIVFFLRIITDFSSYMDAYLADHPSYQADHSYRFFMKWSNIGAIMIHFLAFFFILVFVINFFYVWLFYSIGDFYKAFCTEKK